MFFLRRKHVWIRISFHANSDFSDRMMTCLVCNLVYTVILDKIMKVAYMHYCIILQGHGRV